MESVRTMLFQYLRAAWRRRWLGVVVAWLVCGIGWVGTYTIPNQFESNARLFVDADAILTEADRRMYTDKRRRKAARNSVPEDIAHLARSAGVNGWQPLTAVTAGASSVH